VADGLLVKLIILPFEDSDTVQAGPPAGPPFIAQFNPETLTLNNEIELGPETPPQGDDGGEAKYKGIKPRTFNIELLLDGTGASGPGLDVILQVLLFRETVGFSGKVHRPRFLVLNWGTFIATCVLESFSINYKLFRPDGTPLRAVLSAAFREHKSKALNALLANLSSPDVTHARQIKQDEHLSFLTYQIYKDPRFYMQVAGANALDTVRHLDAGRNLYFPPLG
jgi:contractile injection system tube protein